MKNTLFLPLIFLGFIVANAQSIDITQMVNPTTGDLTYSLPVMEVPGPEGGYPITLNYAAGVRNDQESSWVGLGWNLEAGAISRNVVRFPDDYRGDEYRLIQTHPKECNSKDIPANFIEKFIYATFYPIVSIFRSKDDPSAPGVWDWRLSSRVDTDYFLWVIPVDKDVIYCSELDKDENEYGYGFLYQSSLLESNGAVGQRTYSTPAPYAPYEGFRSKDFHNQASDYIQTYSEELLYENLNPIYWALDNYYISGTMNGRLMPVRFDNPSIATSFNTNKYYDGRVALKKIQVVPENDTKPQFILTNELSNRYNFLKTNSTDFNLNYSVQSNINIDPGPETTLVPDVTQSAAIGITESDREGFENGVLQKGNSVIWYTNKEISDGSAASDGFMNYSADLNRNASSYDKNSNYFPSYGIGGFKVTDMNGMTYHYSLPVFVLSHKVTYLQEEFQSIESYEEPYAAKWLLTAITGPDFVDSGSTSGVVDINDQGYFVIFNYGKFSDNLRTNIPREGFSMDDPENPDAMTKVELVFQDYYLNEIRTRSHTALFVKEVSETNLSYGMDPGGELRQVHRLNLSEVILLSNKNFASAATYIDNTDDSNYTNIEYPDNVWLKEDVDNMSSLINSSRINSVSLTYGRINDNSSLTNVKTYGKQKQTKLPGYEFEYIRFKDGGFDQEHYIAYDRDNYNAYGYYNDYSDVEDISRDQVNPGEAKAYSLWKIHTPSDEQVLIDYESDDYSLISGYSIGANDRYSGGIRVGKITITDNTSGNAYSTEYSYLNSLGRSSGVATREPRIGKQDNTEYFFEDVHGYPAAEVFYGEVKQTNKVNDQLIGGLSGKYFVPDHSMVEINSIYTSSPEYPDEFPNDGWETDYLLNERVYETVYDMSLIGSPLSMTTFDAQETYLSQTRYFYEETDLGELTQGLHLFDEMYRNYDQPYNSANTDDGINELVRRNKTARYINSLSTYKNRRLSKVENYDYVSNAKSIVYSGNYDFITGQPESSITVGENRTILQEVIPAYKISGYSSMGLSVEGGKNVLTQPAFNAAYIIDDVTDPIDFDALQKQSLLSASAQIWEYNGNQWVSGITFNHITANLNSDGTMPLLTSGQQFDWSVSNQSSNWYHLNEPLKRNSHSNVIESVDIDGNYGSQYLSVDETQVLMSIQNARLKEVGYSGAESSWSSNGFNSSIDHNSGTQYSSQSHTGKSSLRLAGGLKGYEFKTNLDEELNGKTLELVVWVNRFNGSLNNFEARYAVDGSTTVLDESSEVIAVDGWSRYRYEILVEEPTVSNQQIAVSVHNKGAGYILIDDFRIAPLNAAVECLVYDEYGYVSHKLNNNHFFTNTMRDEHHKVVEVKIETADGVYVSEQSSYSFSKSE